jgi:GNAT superfamily N-acetyltransferase
MKIIDLDEHHEPLYFVCLEDWSAEMKEAGIHKSSWYAKMKDKGLRVKLALDDNGVAGGMIQYMPVENSFIEGRDLYFIYCIWVHGHKEGRGNFRKKGFGRMLLSAAEADARALGAKGIAAWGLSLPFWMKASWFKRHGFKKADKNGIAQLGWKPFTDDAEAPRWIRQKKKPSPVEGKVTVTAFINGWCPAMNMTYERARRASEEFGESVVFQGIDTLDGINRLEWGIVDDVYVDGKKIRNGPPPSYEKIKKIIGRRIKKPR